MAKENKLETIQEAKSILDNLNSALSELQNKIAEAVKVQQDANIQKMKQDEIKDKLNQQEKGLNEREGKVKEIESIVDFSEKAKKLMADAKDLMKNAEDRQAILEKGLKKLAEDSTAIDKKLADGMESNKKQADALKEERKTFEDKVKAFKVVSAAVK